MIFDYFWHLIHIQEQIFWDPNITQASSLQKCRNPNPLPWDFKDSPRKGDIVFLGVVLHLLFQTHFLAQLPIPSKDLSQVSLYLLLFLNVPSLSGQRPSCIPQGTSNIRLFCETDLYSKGLRGVREWAAAESRNVLRAGNPALASEGRWPSVPQANLVWLLLTEGAGWCWCHRASHSACECSCSSLAPKFGSISVSFCVPCSPFHPSCLSLPGNPSFSPSACLCLR